MGFYVATFGRLTDFWLSTKAGLEGVASLLARRRPSDRRRRRPFTARRRRDSASDEQLLHQPRCDLQSCTTRRAGRSSLWIAMDFNSDRWDFDGRNSRVSVTGSRQNVVRARLGGSLEFVVTKKWNVWLEVEGIVAGDRRRILGDVFRRRPPPTRWCTGSSARPSSSVARRGPNDRGPLHRPRGHRRLRERPRSARSSQTASPSAGLPTHTSRGSRATARWAC